MKKTFRNLLCLIVVCASFLLPQGGIGAQVGDPVRGKTFIEICKTLVCHPSGDMYDLAFFDYSDQSIYRRARPHVPSAQVAWDIVAYIRQLRTTNNINPIPRDTLLYQPGGKVLADDKAFGVELFGEDQWPANLTAQELRAIDAEHVKIAMPLPAWSNEISNYEWLPTHPLPKGVAADLKTTFSDYYANRSIYPGGISEISRALHDLGGIGIPDAVCAYPPDSRWNAELCFDGFKWEASLTLDNAMRMKDLVSPIVQRNKDNQWWEVGHIAHKSRQYHQPIKDIDLHIAGWIHLGWMFDYAVNKNSLYETTPLNQLGLPRHATFVAMRTMVERQLDKSGVQEAAICVDVQKAAEDGYSGWLYNSGKFAYQYITDLLNSGWSGTSACKTNINRAQIQVNRKLPASQAGELQIMANQIISRMP